MVAGAPPGNDRGGCIDVVSSLTNFLKSGFFTDIFFFFICTFFVSFLAMKVNMMGCCFCLLVCMADGEGAISATFIVSRNLCGAGDGNCGDVGLECP